MKHFLMRIASHFPTGFIALILAFTLLITFSLPVASAGTRQPYKSSSRKNRKAKLRSDDLPMLGKVDTASLAPARFDDRLTPQTIFSNPAAITINDSASNPTAASPYPSTITVTSSPNSITNLTVTITGFSHTSAADVDMLLVGPTGAKMLIWSDVGGNNSASNLNITLSDAGATFMGRPNGSPSTLGSGTFKPTNCNSTSNCDTVNNGSADDAFPASAPAGPYPSNSPNASVGSSTIASIFNGTSPVGIWKLYVSDDAGGDSGSISGGWSLNITATGPTATNGSVAGNITDTGGAPISGATINLDGTESRKSITDANGSYHFDNVETNGFYTVTPSRANYTFSPANRSFSLLGVHTEASFTASANGDHLNAIDTTEFFVRQQYLDFLGREPDEGGFNFWSDQILSCAAANSADYHFDKDSDRNRSDETVADCIQSRRINVSAAFFFSIEFQGTGGLVDRLYRASHSRRPQFGEFMSDVKTMNGIVVGQTDWEHRLDASKTAFIAAWIQRPAFRAAYDNLADDSYVDKLISNTGVAYLASERDALVNGLVAGTLTRANVLQRISEDSRFIAAKFSEQFVLMEYFGYLRRDPDESGYQFWLAKLNKFNGNFEQAEMVKAFLISIEYRQRFPR